MWLFCIGSLHSVEEQSLPPFLGASNQTFAEAMAVFHNQGKSIAPADKAGAYTGPVSIGRFIAPIAGKTLSRGGAALAELMAEWPAIAGAALASYTSPEKLSKGAREPNSEGKPAPAVLHLKVDPAKALEVQYSTPQLIERINQTLGYRAVSGVRLVQAPFQRKTPARRKAPSPAPVSAAPQTDAEPKPENRLAAALARMGRGIKARGCSG